MSKKLLIVTFVTGIFGTAALPAISAETVIRIAPPELRIEKVPEARHGYQWAPGYWGWRHHRHTWVKGTWMRERPGYVYHQPNWEQHDGIWVIQKGTWSRNDRDGDGVPNRRDRQPDNPSRH